VKIGILLVKRTVDGGIKRKSIIGVYFVEVSGDFFVISFMLMLSFHVPI